MQKTKIKKRKAVLPALVWRRKIRDQPKETMRKLQSLHYLWLNVLPKLLAILQIKSGVALMTTPLMHSWYALTLRSGLEKIIKIPGSKILGISILIAEKLIRHVLGNAIQQAMFSTRVSNDCVTPVTIFTDSNATRVRL